MTKLRFAILHHGYIENDLAFNVAMPVVGTIHDKDPRAVWKRFPFFSVLIQHPELGNIMYDTGCAPGDEKERFPRNNREILPTYIEPEDFLDKRLQSIGLTVNDIDMVILSHSHFDHMGGLFFFQHTRAGQNIITGRKDFMFGLLEAHRRYQPPSFPYFKPNFEFEGLEFNFVDGDTELAPDLHIISLEGHAPIVLGLLIHLESGTWILPNDSMPLEMNYGPPPLSPRQSGQTYDSLGFLRSVDKIAALQRKYRANILYGHDFNKYPEYKKAPDFYE